MESANEIRPGVMPKSVVMQLALGTLIGMPLIAILIDRFSEPVDLASLLVGRTSWVIQLAWGALAGTGIGLAARFIIRRPFMERVGRRYADVLGRFDLSLSEIAFVSVCAGVGEELLFRGAIQPYLGIVLTSMIFVAIHGYLNPMDWRLSIYGLSMTLFIALLGWMAESVGLLSSILAHTVIDIILLLNLQSEAGKWPTGVSPGGEENPDPTS